MDGKEEAAASMLSSDKQTPSKKTPQYLVTLAVTMATFAGGNIIGWTSPALPYLQSTNSSLPVASHEGSWIGSLLAVGAFVGALPAGPIADMIGRKLTLLSLVCPLMISWIMIFFASSVYTLYFARVIAGIGLGAVCTTVPMYVSEIAETSIRGTLCSSFQLMLVTGILYTYTLGAIVSYNMLTIVNGVIPLLFLLLFFKAPESPIYLLKKNRREEAKNSLLVLRGRHYNVNKELEELENELNSKTGGNNKNIIKVLFNRASIVSLIICLGLMTFQQLSGINIVIFYTASIFKDAGSTLDPSVATILVGLAQVIATIVAGILIDKAGRKLLLQVSAVIMSICLFVLGWYFHVKDRGDDTTSFALLPLVSVIVYILVFGIGFGPIPWMMTGEILPGDIKGIGTSLSVAMNWFLAFNVTKTYQIFIELIGSAKTYWLFGVICIIGFFFSTFVVIETKGKSLSEIQTELSGRNRNSNQRRSNAV